MGTFGNKLINFLKDLPLAANIKNLFGHYCAYHAEMVVKSIFAVISIYNTKINWLQLARKKFPEISDTKGGNTKGGNQFFKFGVVKKKGELKFFQNPRGEPKPYTLCTYLFNTILKE